VPFPVAQEEQHHPAAVGYLEHGLRLAERLAVQAYSRAQAITLDALGGLELPRSPVTADDQAHLRALGSLYLLAQLENASLLSTVELIAGLAVSGGLQANLGPAAARLMEFWRHRNERLSPDERHSVFDRVFDSDFDNLMINLCEALFKLDEGVITPGASNPLQQARVRTSAEQLAEHLLNNTNAEGVFVANDILTATRDATEILKDPHVEHAFGANTIWNTVEAILRRYRTPAPDFSSFVTRGKAGLTILAWLADVRGVPDNSAKPFVGLDNPVVPAAVAWLQASLSIEQSKADEPPVPTAAKQNAGGA
jgi:hypothetical protein